MYENDFKGHVKEVKEKKKNKKLKKILDRLNGSLVLERDNAAEIKKMNQSLINIQNLMKEEKDDRAGTIAAMYAELNKMKADAEKSKVESEEAIKNAKTMLKFSRVYSYPSSCYDTSNNPTFMLGGQPYRLTNREGKEALTKAMMHCMDEELSYIDSHSAPDGSILTPHNGVTCKLCIFKDQCNIFKPFYERALPLFAYEVMMNSAISQHAHDYANEFCKNKFKEE